MLPAGITQSAERWPPAPQLKQRRRLSSPPVRRLRFLRFFLNELVSVGPGPAALNGSQPSDGGPAMAGGATPDLSLSR